MKYIEAKNLCFGYQKRIPVFENISFRVEIPDNKGHIVAITGSSGCGKTTLLKLLLGIETSYEGTLISNPTNPIFSYVPQEPILFEHLSINGNARYFERIAFYKNKFDENLFMELVDALDLKDIINSEKSINKISGGQKQRLSVLRALSIKPDFLLMDEPLTGLDNEVKENFLIKLLEITNNFGLIVFYVSHHTDEIKLISNDVIYMINKFGKHVSSIEHGPIEDFIRNPPSISASQAFNDTNYNTINLSDLKNSGISISHINDFVSEECHYFGFNNASITFVKEEGIEFSIVSKTTLYIMLRLKSCNQFIKIETSEYNKKNLEDYTSFHLDQHVHQYNKDGLRINNRKKQ